MGSLQSETTMDARLRRLGLTRVRAIILAAIVFNAALAAVVLYGIGRVNEEEALKNARVVVLPAPRPIAAFSLTDQAGKPVDNAVFDGKWSFVFFGFTHCPDVCPTAMAMLRQVEQTLLADAPDAAAAFQGVLVSVDPERDTPDVLEPYVRAFSERFVGITGTTAGINALARDVHVAFARVPDRNRGLDRGYQVDHSAHIVIVNPDGGHHGYIKLPHDADAIAAAYLALRGS